MVETNGHSTGLRDRGTGELMKQLSTQVSALVRQEVELAKVEVTEKGKKAGAGAGMLRHRRPDDGRDVLATTDRWFDSVDKIVVVSAYGAQIDDRKATRRGFPDDAVVNDA